MLYLIIIWNVHWCYYALVGQDVISQLYILFGTKFCSPPQNLKLINTPLHLNICALEVQQLLVLTSKSNKAQ